MAEQQRIVSEIEHIFTFIDQLEKDKLSMERFIQQTKHKVLNLAIQGKLVSQNSSDEPASVLLEKIRKEKAALAKTGKKTPKTTDDSPHYRNVPFEVPQSWVWCKNKDIYIENVGGGTPSKSNRQYWNGPIKWASVKDLLEGELYLSDTIDTISEEGLTNSSSNLVKANNIIVCTRISLDRIVINNIDVAINQDLRGITLSSFFNRLFYVYYYKTLDIQGQGSTVKGITQKEFEEIFVPLPPVAEQQRIVSQIEKIFSTLDSIQSNLGLK